MSDAPPPRRVTITDVARAASASASTVSRVLNGQPTVDPTLAERVRHAATELGYRPNVAAQGLARGRLGTIGVLVPDLANPYFEEILKAVSAVARAAEKRVVIADSDEDQHAERELAEDLLGHADALLLCSPRMARSELTALAAAAGASAGRPRLVIANRVEHSVPVPAVSVDEFHGMLAIAGHLAQLGHTRVGYLAGAGEAWSERERRRALSTAEAFGLHATIIECGTTIAHGHQAAISALEHDLTAIIANNDIVALGALTRLQELDIAVPQQLSLTGFDDIPFARYAKPPLTTIHVPHNQVGTRAGQMLLELIAADSAPEAQLIQPELVIRNSTAKPQATTTTAPPTTATPHRPRKAKRPAQQGRP